MSTDTIAAPAAPKARQAVTASSKEFTLRQGDVHSFRSKKIEQPLSLRIVVAEVGSEFMTINGKAMSGPWLQQTVGPPRDPLSHQSARLRQKDRAPEMSRSDYRWTYTIPGVVRFTLSEVEDPGNPGIRFEVDETYAS
jgi:hypothetical protein